MTFSEIRQKDIINISDGKRLGRAVDLILRCEGERAYIEALVVPAAANLWKLFKNERDGIAIAWERIRRIGDDVILVDVDATNMP